MNPALLGVLAGLVGKYITYEQGKKEKESEIFAANLKGADELFFRLMKLFSQRLYLSQSLKGAIEDNLARDEVFIIHEEYRAALTLYNTDRVSLEVMLKRYFGPYAADTFTHDVHGYNPANEEDRSGFRKLGFCLREIYEAWENESLGPNRVSPEKFQEFEQYLGEVSEVITKFYNYLSEQINEQKLGDRAPR